PFVRESAVSCDARWRPHDLLRLRRLPAFDGEPAWVRHAFARAPYAVVRRAFAAPEYVAIGLRGAQRSQRYGTWVASADIIDAVAPEALARGQPLSGRGALPAFVALAALQRDTRSPLHGFAWGPTGSAGFELATKVETVTASSDLDLLIRMPNRFTHESAASLLDHLQTLAREAGIRVDAQLETPEGGVALVEWAEGKARVMARHARGPQLIADPWADASCSR
ncbi:MAG TPA: malonate decarboxylase holo-ACP synthase, partial [Paraburkholderia sp.]|uniref:malonate decarboxylase holo-ACP synthase n=1 Tax=Paraburkholderia sp. TaxID=1926495 RepID=UPI002ED02995